IGANRCVLQLVTALYNIYAAITRLRPASMSDLPVCLPAENDLMRPWLLRASLLLAFAACPIGSICAQQVDFTHDVRPILSRHCFKCHGPDDKARKAKLRLDVRSVAIGITKSGVPAIVPRKPEGSELVGRILGAEETEIMPPPTTKNPLTDAQKEILKRWITAGAEYREHWGFVAPRQAPLPGVRKVDWPRNAIDYFVLARLEAEGLQP